MEFLRKNYIQTSTAIAVNNGTLTAANMITSDAKRQFRSDGDASDLTITSITITLDETSSVSRIALLEMNFKNFRIYYDGTTASTFTLSGGATITSSWSSNSTTSMFLRCDTVSCKTVTLEATETIVADREKSLGQFIVSTLDLTLTRIPSAKGYKPVINRNEVTHKLSDGGTRLHYIRPRYESKVKLKYITETLRESLRTIYNDDDTRIFCPFGTQTSWDVFIFDAVWVGKFDFLTYSDDAVGAGFSGTINLRESHV